MAELCYSYPMKRYQAPKSRRLVATSSSKDAWDKIAALTPSIVTLVLGLLGAYATYTYNEISIEEKRQEAILSRNLQENLNKRELLQRSQQAANAKLISETQQLEKLFSYISSKDAQSREFGYSMFAALGREQLALRIINFNKDKAGLRIARSLRDSANPAVRAAAAESLANLLAIPDRFTVSRSNAVAEPVRSDMSSRLSYFVGYLAKIGFSPPKSKINIEFLDGENNAYYSPNDNKLYIGPKIAADPNAPLVIFAEYVMLKSKGSDKYLENPEYKFLDSAVSEYFSASHLNSAKISPLAGAIFGRSDPYLRNLENNYSYNRILNGEVAEYHAIGEVWGGAFWQIRTQIGRHLFDPVLAKAWMRFRHEIDTPLHKSFLDCLINTSDNSLKPEQATAIRTIFAIRGFPIDSMPKPITPDY